MQFGGLLSCNRETTKLWQVIWFAIMWFIWLSKNGLVFINKQETANAMMENIKVTSWLWLNGKVDGIIYPLSSWLSNPVGCLGIVMHGQIH